jgi:hypothetical protein
MILISQVYIELKLFFEFIIIMQQFLENRSKIIEECILLLSTQSNNCDDVKTNFESKDSFFTRFKSADASFCVLCSYIPTDNIEMVGNRFFGEGFRILDNICYVEKVFANFHDRSIIKYDAKSKVLLLIF